MQNDTDTICAGDLFQELREIEKLTRNEEETENVYTFTYRCTTFLTIMCC